MKHDFLKRINEARVYEVANKTPLEFQTNLSRRFHNQIFLKREDLQPVFSFKIRGAYNKMSGLSKEQLEKGVIAASAGNHAQAIALIAQKLGCRALLVMPTTSPLIKIDAVKHMGAEVVLWGDSYSDAFKHALEIEKKEGLTFVHPYDDPDVIAGQGTIAKEILDDYKKPIHAVFTCVGGGGLLAGLATYIKAIRPEIKVIGVEAKDAEAMTLSLKAGKRVALDQVGLFADGAAIKEVGELTFPLCQAFVDEMIVVDNDEICAAIKDVFEDTRSILEPAGALSVAGMKSYIKHHNLKGETLVGIASGANMNFDRLRFVAERAEIGEKREAVLAVTIPEKPGAFKNFCKLLGQRNITEFNYRFSDPKEANIYVGIAIHDTDEPLKLKAILDKEGLPTIDLTDNEVAKLHLRHLVGGHAPQAKNEMVFRFEFPEKPGALIKFLETMGHNWNISLFHYRNHGADFGRILVGMQVPPEDEINFEVFLNQLGYPFWDETDNPAYKLFLG